MTQTDSIKDITVVFPSKDYHFTSQMKIGCSIYKISKGEKTYVDKQCFPLNNRIHIATNHSFVETDGLLITVTDVPNPYTDQQCLHHAWQISVSERDDDDNPIASTSTMIDTFLPVIDFGQGNKQKIIFWDQEKEKEITSESIEILIGVF